MVKWITVFVLKQVARAYGLYRFLKPWKRRGYNWDSLKRCWSYPQTWNFWYNIFPRWKHKGTMHIKNVKNEKCLQFIHSLCNLLTGHEISKTESGYGGGNMIDYHCRWCDQLIRIPMSEMPKDARFYTNLWKQGEDGFSLPKGPPPDNPPPGPGPASEFGQDKI